MSRTICIMAVFCLIAVGISRAQPDANIAHGKKYTLSPRPNYSYCTDPDDKTQLTDGVYSKGHFWTQKTTVGWSNAYPAIITIDLGAVEPICGVSYSTAAGVAGVRWPASILILASEDGRTYYYTGDLVELDAEHGQLKADGYGLHRFWTDRLSTRGRFVQLVILQGSAYTFVDEVEVYRGADDLMGKPMTGVKIEDMKQFFQEIELAKSVRRRLNNDLAAVREGLKTIEQREDMEKELAAIGEDIPKAQVVLTENFKTILPLNDLHRRIFAVQAACWRAKGFKPLTIWQKNPWDMVSPTETPMEGGATIRVGMMSNEFRSAAFLISNAAPTPVEPRLSIEGLPGRPNPRYVQVHDAPFTDTKSGTPVIAALPYAEMDGERYLFRIPSGMTRQVWLTFHPKDVPAGEYEGAILIEPGGVRVPVALRIYPFVFPDQPALHLGGWDYTDRGNDRDVTEENRGALIAHLREHFVDTPWATSPTMSRGAYDENGSMIEEPASEGFEKWIQRWPGARNYYVFCTFSGKFCGFEPGTPVFRKAVGNWITWWVNKLKEWNIRPSQLGLLLSDEPNESKKEAQRIIVEYGRAIRDAQPEVVIWEDPTFRQPWTAPPEMFEVCRALCPNLPMWIEQGKPFADFYVRQREAGRRLWFYSCSGPGKLLDPYSYHRMQHWFCWRYDAKGSCFWSFGDSSGASTWNEYLAKRGAYTPVFFDAITVTPGKHMEAIREGVEDYEYLRMLRDRIAELETKGAQRDALTSAKALLASSADRVTACMTGRDKIKWEEPKDRSVADTVRIEVLEMLLKLKDM